MRTARDRLDMLEWEMQALEQTPLTDSQAVAYRTSHCVLTAWHMTDWIFEELPTHYKTKWSIGSGKPVQRFQEWAKAASPAIRICRQFADAAKHRTLAHQADHDTTTEQMEWRSEDGTPLYLWALLDAEGVYSVRNVVRVAHEFWLARLIDAGIERRSSENTQILPDSPLRKLIREQLEAGVR